MPLEAARVLDFGCGWGRLTRMLARDVTPGQLYGCDPAQGILDVCRADRVPAELARSDFLPQRVPFDGPFDLAFAFSVFTHLSERARGREPRRAARGPRARRHPGAHRAAAVLPGGRRCGLTRSSRTPPSRATRSGAAARCTYGETVIPLAYVRERWSDRFALLEAGILLGDLFQAVLILRRS